jgi:hypothetical protein
MHSSERGSAILEDLATQYARGVTAESQIHNMAYSDGGWTRTKPWACSSSPDRTGGCSAARPPAAAQSMRFCTSETGDEPCTVCAPETRRKSVLLATMNVCGGRACALESDATAWRCSWLRHPHVGSRRAGCSAPTVNPTQGGLRDATEYLTGDPRRAAPGRRLQACRGRARLRCGRCELAAPRGGLAAGGETTAESGVHISMRPGAGSNSRCGFKFEISRAVRVLKLDSEAALPRSLPGSGAWE